MTWKIAIGVVIGVILAYLPFVNYGKSLGRAGLIQELQEDRAKILKDGKQVDETVYSADDSALCSLLGGCGVPDESSSDKPL